MFVRAPGSRSRSRFRLPPALSAAVALLLLAMAATAQLRAAGETQPVSEASAPAATQAAKGYPSLWELFLKGGPVMWVLAGSSVVALAIIFERLYSLRRSHVIPPGFLPGLRAVYRDPIADRERAVNYCTQNDSPIARMVVAFIKRLPRGFSSAEKALEDAGGNESLRLRANLRIFYAIGSVATLLGLIGTIAGMIKAFMETARAGDGEDKVSRLSAGIYEAMVCTFGGLAVAILVTLFYYYFIGRIEKLVTEINDELTLFSDEYGLLPESAEELSTTTRMPLLQK